jgi:cytoskeletal protein RodZ
MKMKTIGIIFEEARLTKNLSLEDIEKETKIRKQFIELIEKEDWNKLPEFPVVQGFIKNLATALSIDREHALALLRRDYPPGSYKKLKINPNPDLSQKFVWSPKATFLVGIVIVVLAIAAYLVMQYINFISPPILKVLNPADGQVVTETNLMVNGITDPEASVIVNNQPALVEDNGNFSTKIEIYEGTKDIEIVAKARTGKESRVHRSIVPELK